MKLQTKIFVGLALGAALGGAARASGPSALALVNGLEPIGTAFIKLIGMVVVPLVIASLYVGIAALGDVRKLGRIGGKTLAFFLATTALAATIGLVVGVLSPIGRNGMTLESASSSAPTGAIGFVQSLLAMIPSNPFGAAAEGELLPLMVAVCLFASAATVARGDAQRTLLRVFEGLNELSMVVIGWLMQLAPYAVAVLIAAAIARSGAELLEGLAQFAAVVVIALVLHVGIVLVPMLRMGARESIRDFFRGVSDALLLAFSTASSSATLPVSMAAIERAGVPNEIASFVLPAGTTMNKNGAAVYKAVTAVFIARLAGMDLHACQMLAIGMASAVAAFAGAGVPGSSLVTTMIVLNAIGLGTRASAGIALVAAVDRPLDMCRTTVNTIGNLVGAAWVEKSERRSSHPERSDAGGHAERSEASALVVT